MNRLAVVGGGSWGTALALALSPRFEEVRMWVHDPELAAQMEVSRENSTYLPRFQLAGNIRVSDSLPYVMDGTPVVLGVVPSKHARVIYRRLAGLLSPDTVIVSATKGLEAGTLLRMSELIREECPAARVAVLSGPNFAREVAAGEPAATVISSEEESTAALVQNALAGPAFRLYTNGDPVGVELGAALKNVIAIAAGVCNGLGLGNNSIAALVTRGLAEITRLAIASGGSQRTLAGLAGMGDLVLTCYGELSRNRHVGLELAKGRGIAEITGSMKMVAEGVSTTASAIELARRQDVDLPITLQMGRILNGECSPRDAIRELMERSLKSE